MNADFEARFYEFLYSHGYASQDAKHDHLQFYVRYFTLGERVLDLGCGRGEFVELLNQQGCHAEGVDADPQMVAVGRAQGLTIHESDALAFLNSQTQAYDGIFTSNFLEHLAPSEATALIESAYNALKPGGKLLVAVPNPASLIVHLYEFWRDATHVRLYNRQLVEFMLNYCGFEIVASGENETTRWQPELVAPNISEAQIDLAITHQAVPSEFATIPSTSIKNALPGTSIDLTPIITANRELPIQPPTVQPLLPQSGGPLRRMILRTRDWVAKFLVERVISKQFHQLRVEVANLKVENEIYRNAIQNVRADLGTLANAIADLSKMTHDLGDSIDNLKVNIGTLGDATKNLKAELDDRSNKLIQLNQKLIQENHHALELQRAIQSMQSSTLSLFPPREIYVVGQRKTD